MTQNAKFGMMKRRSSKKKREVPVPLSYAMISIS